MLYHTIWLLKTCVTKWIEALFGLGRNILCKWISLFPENNLRFHLSVFLLTDSIFDIKCIGWIWPPFEPAMPCMPSNLANRSHQCKPLSLFTTTRRGEINGPKNKIWASRRSRLLKNHPNAEFHAKNHPTSHRILEAWQLFRGAWEYRPPLLSSNVRPPLPPPSIPHS